MAASERDRALAETLATAVAAANGRTWRKVTTILDLFGVHRLTPNVRTRLSEAFESAGIETNPPWQDVQRYQSLRLSAPGSNGGAPRDASRVQRAEDGSIARVTLWRPGQRMQEADLRSVASSEDVVAWIEVDAATAEPASLWQTLRSALGESVTEEMVRDLLEAEPFPKISYSTERPELRSVSAFRALAEEGQEEGREGVAGRLVFQLIEFIAGPGWLVSCWHPSRVYVGASESDRPAERVEQLMSAVEDRWLRDEGRTEGDLGTAVLDFLACSYTDARRVFHSWLESWELEFFRHVALEDEQFDVQSLIELRGLVGQFSKRLRAMKVPRAIARGSWFHGVSNLERARDVDEMLTRAIEDLMRLGEQIRSSFDLVQVQLGTIQQHAAVEQQRASHGQQQASERLQRRFEGIAAVLLWPTLVAGVFGANTAVVGGDGWYGFLLMIGLMVGGGFLTYWYLSSVRRSQQGAEDVGEERRSRATNSP